MASESLQGMRVAILVFDGFEHSDLVEPKVALDETGAATFVISRSERITGWYQGHWGHEEPADILLPSAKAEDFHALFLPGRAMPRERIKTCSDALQFVRHFMDSRKPVAALGGSPAIILETDAVRGRIMTSAPALRSELENAGAIWVDQTVVCDANLVTGRKANDLHAFVQEMIRLFAQAREHTKDMRKTA